MFNFTSFMCIPTGKLNWQTVNALMKACSCNWLLSKLYYLIGKFCLNRFFPVIRNTTASTASHFAMSSLSFTW